MNLYAKCMYCVQRNQELTQRSADDIDQLVAVGDVSSTFAFKRQNHLRDKAERDERAACDADRIHYLVCRNRHPDLVADLLSLQRCVAIKFSALMRSGLRVEVSR